ncbi:metallophosphoesterase family protein [Spirulina sp. CS-785/01]|uniref:metallophosphoesterase family protein n=1 Tax=Spirulina sp. CS-785/01 TaxID=3021716 RepID=UPI00232DD930|nr:metallophosphoesterase family protein [Spirulina sp. CS-785/01]MDB9314838.1 metallophosphoesterase family protein [Spirulina sp. CS-785/01]
MSRRIFIGDVHGHYEALMMLLDAIAPGAKDQVYFVGDLIDRGPQSAQVIDFVMNSSYQSILGNHEQMLLEVMGQENIPEYIRQSWLYSGGHATLKSYGTPGIARKHLDWIRHLPTHLDLGDVWLVHAGVDPQLPISEQTSEHFCWIRDEFHCMPQPYFEDKLIITGHTITFTIPGVMPGKLAMGAGWLDIDTGAYHRQSGWLTGVDFDQQTIYQVNTRKHHSRTLSWDEGITKVNPTKILPKIMGLKPRPFRAT